MEVEVEEKVEENSIKEVEEVKEREKLKADLEENV